MNYGELKSMIKVAKTRQVKEIERLYRAGKLDQANALAKRLQDAGVLKVTQQGTQLRELGAGAEGLAHAVIGAKDKPDQISVRKMYDPKGKLYVPGVADRKVQIGEMVRGDKGFAEIYTRNKPRMTPKGNIPYMLKEFVPGEAIGRTRAAYNEYTDELRDSVRRATDRAYQKGIQLRDIMGHGDNVRVTPSGTMKAIDFIPDDRRLMIAAQGNVRKYYPNLTADEARRVAQGIGFAPGDITEAQRQRLRSSLGSGSKQSKKVRGSKAGEGRASREARERLRAKLGRTQLGRNRRSKVKAIQAAAAPRRSAARSVTRMGSQVSKLPAWVRPAAAAGLGTAGLAAGGLGLAGYLANKRSKEQAAR